MLYVDVNILCMNAVWKYEDFLYNRPGGTQAYTLELAPGKATPYSREMLPFLLLQLEHQISGIQQSALRNGVVRKAKTLTTAAFFYVEKHSTVGMTNPNPEMISWSGLARIENKRDGLKFRNDPPINYYVIMQRAAPFTTHGEETFGTHKAFQGRAVDIMPGYKPETLDWVNDLAIFRVIGATPKTA